MIKTNLSTTSNNSSNSTMNNDKWLLLDTIEKSKSGDDNATLILIDKYRNLILKYSSSYHLKNYDKEDLIQLGSMAIIKAIKKFDCSKGASSIDSYIINSIINSYKQLARSNIKYNSESSVNIIVSDSGDDGVDIQSLIPDSFNLELHILDTMKIKRLNSILSNLSKSQKELIRIAYFDPNYSLHSYCKEYNLNYPAKRRELLKLIDSIKAKYFE